MSIADTAHPRSDLSAVCGEPPRSHDPQLARLLVVPGLDGDPSLLGSAAPRLFGAFRPLMYDHSADPAADGLDGLARRALRILEADREGTAPAYVCGESFGGAVALTLARLFPERVQGLIFLSAFGWYPAAPSLTARLGLMAWTALGDRLAGHVFTAWRPLSAPGALGFGAPADVARAYHAQPTLSLPAYRRKCDLALRFDARPWLGSIRQPAFVLVGTWDPVVPTRAGLDLSRRLPRARLHRLPGGHLVHVVRATETGGLIATWRRETEDPSSA